GGADGQQRDQVDADLPAPQAGQDLHQQQPRGEQGAGVPQQVGELAVTEAAQQQAAGQGQQGTAGQNQAEPATRVIQGCSGVPKGQTVARRCPRPPPAAVVHGPWRVSQARGRASCTPVSSKSRDCRAGHGLVTVNLVQGPRLSQPRSVAARRGAQSRDQCTARWCSSSAY